jgi:hypothetical protein
VCPVAFKIAVPEPEGSSEPESSATSPVEPKPFEPCGTLLSATPSTTVRKRGPVARRRFQKGSFVKEPNGSMFSMFYTDAVGPDGLTVTKQVKQFLGNLG